jgi:hypothetical protein
MSPTLPPPPPAAGLTLVLIALATVALLVLGSPALEAQQVASQPADFLLPGTQPGQIGAEVIGPSVTCSGCHANYDVANSPGDTWKGSLMAQSGRDPLFFAQMTTANQDVPNVGTFCMRCHVPNSFQSGHALDVDGSTLDDYDRDGVSCHLCHTMVDPLFIPGISPDEDAAALAQHAAVPQHYANAMFVLDPTGTRRGPRPDAVSTHATIYSPFHSSSSMCGTCHDVGNVAVSRQADGTYAYNTPGLPTPDTDAHSQFPLERTYTEWSLSEFADTGVDMGGRFGGEGVSTVSSCQDCHMPRAEAKAAFFGPTRPDVARHDFAGASSWVLDIIALNEIDNPEVDQAALGVASRKAVDMLQRAASLKLRRVGSSLRVRVINETGHKLPTGHIEGRRVFLNVQFLDAAGSMLREFGRYDPQTAHLDEATTRVYEMQVGVSRGASAATGLAPGVTTHMTLANTIEKDNRIPPRGFNNQAFEDGGAPVVQATYADGQYWDDVAWAIPPGSARVRVTLYYQTVTRHYIEALRDGNHTDDKGRRLYDLWLATNKAAPIAMQIKELKL